MDNPKRKNLNNPITTVFKIKYLRRNLTNKVKDLYTENYKTLLIELEENLNKWKDIPYSRIENFVLLKLDRGDGCTILLT